MAGQLTIDTLKASTGVLATQNGMTGIAKAWFQMGASGGTVVINGSFNISSITRQAQGQYTVNFTTAMPNTTYCAVISNSSVQSASQTNSQVFSSSGSNVVAPTTTAFAFSVSVAFSGGFWDPNYACAVVYSS
jgi:hypothetical protein